MPQRTYRWHGAPARRVAGDYVAVFIPSISLADTYNRKHVVSDQAYSRPHNNRHLTMNTQKYTSGS
jgi:hypothetical protein